MRLFSTSIFWPITICSNITPIHSCIFRQLIWIYFSNSYMTATMQHSCASLKPASVHRSQQVQWTPCHWSKLLWNGVYVSVPSLSSVRAKLAGMVGLLYIYIHICIYMNVYMYAYIHMCMTDAKFAVNFVKLYIHIHIHICIYIYIYIHAYMYVCANIHVSTNQSNII